MAEWDDPHHAESDRVRATGDPEQIKGLYADYGRELAADYAGREHEVTQHGSELVAEWQGTQLPPQVPPGLVIDIGCGPRPEISLRFARLGRHVVSTDISPGILALARQISQHEAPDASMSFVIADAENLPFRTACAAAVIADDVIEHVPAPPLMSAECARVIRDDGIVSISTPNRRALSVFIDRARDLMRLRIRPREAYYLVPSHLIEFTRPELRRLFAASFADQRYAIAGWDAEGSRGKLVVNKVTGWPGLRWLGRTWIVLLRGPTRAAIEPFRSES